MYQLKIGTLPLPKLYVCEDWAEAEQARSMGVPYLVKPYGWDDQKLVKAVLWRTLMRKFPYIRWHDVLGLDGCEVQETMVSLPEEPDDWQPKTGKIREVEAIHRVNPGIDTCGSSDEAMEITTTDEYRTVEGGLDEDDTFDKVVDYKQASLDDYIGDLGWYVNIEELQALHVLPTFLDDVAEAVKVNLMNTMYIDGYNKKLECNLGAWSGSSQAPNLIILDVSGSIPSGVAGTMVSLIETLRSQANADLIITSRRSVYYPAQTELPNADKLAYLIGGCNECNQFYAILRDHILGRHWGNVIVFGDQDAPTRNDITRNFKKTGGKMLKANELQSTRIDRIMAFHTYRLDVPGYGLWAVDACPKAEIVYNDSWTADMRKW